jgi:hypothetical protein
MYKLNQRVKAAVAEIAVVNIDDRQLGQDA